MRRKHYSNRRSGSTRTKPMRSERDAYAYMLEYTQRWATTGTDYEANMLGQAGPGIALAQMAYVGVQCLKSLLDHFAAANETPAPPSAGLRPSSRMTRRCGGREAAAEVDKPF